jgi:hypothetical protein
MKVIPTFSLKFSLNEFYKKKLGKNTDLFPQQLVPIGLLTGATLISLTYPLDVLRTRFAIAQKNESIIKYSKNVLFNEGMKGFYKGFNVSVISGSLHIGLQMSSYDIYKNYLRNHFNENNQIFTNLLCGSGAGLTAQILVFPADVIRKKMHIDGKLKESKKYINSYDCLKKTASTYGFRYGLYSGLMISCIKTIPSAAIQFASYEYFKNMFLNL